jgi:hypothetical protein
MKTQKVAILEVFKRKADYNIDEITHFPRGNKEG